MLLSKKYGKNSKMFAKLFCFAILFTTCSLVQATNSEVRNDPVFRNRRQQSPFETFLENCPFGTVLSDILLASPSSVCKDAFLDIAQIDPSQYVDLAERVLTDLSVICEEECRSFVYSTLLRCLPSSIPLLNLACASNTRQIQCWQAIGLNNGTGVLVSCYPERYLPISPETGSGSATESSTTVDQETANNTPTCIAPCAGALNQLRSVHGCCVYNAFNTSTFGLLDLGVADYNLWSSCNIETFQSPCPKPTFVNIFAADIKDT